MFRLIAVTLAALYGILFVFGDDARRPTEVARAEPVGLTLVSASVLSPDVASSLYVSSISDRKAVEMAVAAGKAIRAERRAQAPSRFTLASVRAENAIAASEAKPTYWYVTGSRVNLRGGPGTSNAVVGQVTYGMEAEVLTDRNGWYEIRLADGSGSGWIFGKFLNDKLPG